MTDNDDQYAERLREVLHQEGSAMGTSDDGLNRIMSQAHGSGGSGGGRQRSWLAPLAVAAAAVVLIGGLGIGISLSRSDGDDTNALPGTSSSGPAPSGNTSVSSAASTPEPSQSVSTSQGTSTTAPVDVALPVYYVADMNGRGTRLYREFHTLPTTPDAKAQTALAELFGGNAVDPDYSSLWPSGTQIRTLTVDGPLATLDVSDFPGAGAEAQVLAVQQVVWTVTGANPSVKKVQITVNGQPPSSAALAKPVGRASAFAVQANVWITAPTEGQTTHSPVKVTVYGTGFEGNVPIKIFKNDTQVAAQAVTTMMGGFAQASTTFTLPAGTYVVRAYNDNGKDGTLLLWDTKTFTVS
jgi:uncharacterized protein (DUF2141 family)